MKRNVFILIIVSVILSCEKESDIVEINEEQFILDSLSQFDSFIYFTTNQDTIYSTDFEYFGGSSSGINEDSISMTIFFKYDIERENSFDQFRFYFISKDSKDKLVLDWVYKYKYFDDYCNLFEVGNLSYCNNFNRDRLIRGITLSYYYGLNSVEYISRGDENILSYKDFNFTIESSYVNYETQIIELDYSFNCELILNNDFVSPNFSDKISINDGHGKMTIAFYKNTYN